MPVKGMITAMSDTIKTITERLFALQDKKYRDFHAKLLPNVNPESIIGVRTPDFRKLAKELFKNPDTSEFLDALPHKYYDENNLHAALIEQIKDYDECIAQIERFLPYVDNWATCDIMSPKVFKKHTDELLVPIRRWLASEHTYTIRFGIEMLMSYYLDDKFKPEYFDYVAVLRSEEYYVNMMIAWYFATALAKQYDSALPYIEQHKLAVWTHNKAIQKSCESYRITDEQKAYLRTLKIK